MPLPKLLNLFRRKSQEPGRGAPSIPTVTFDSSRVTTPVKADVLATLKSAGDIPRSALPALGKVAIASVAKGRDFGMLRGAIMSSGITGMTEQRAAEIARHVHNRATSIMDVERMVSIGAEQAVWMFSGAFCYPNAKSPSAAQVALDAAHKAANGRRYRVREGLTIAGVPTWPGREQGCKCLSRPVVPGFS